MKKVLFFIKMILRASQNCFYFYQFWGLIGTVFDSKIFWRPMVSVMLPKLLYQVIDLQQSNSECLMWHQSSYLGVQSQKMQFVHFLISRWRFQNLPILNFGEFFFLQALLENFLCVKNTHARYLKGPPGSGVYSSNKIMVMQRINPFLLKKTFIPP